MAVRAPLLNLDTLTERPTVVIDGVAYALSPPDALSAVDYHRFRKLTPRLDALWNGDGELSDDEASEVERILDTLASIVLDAPADVHAKLTDMQRLAIYQAFLSLPQTTLLRSVVQHAAAGETTKRKTGAPFSRGSRGSMGGRRASGLPKPLSGSSEPM